jgi:hypothetical protein
MRHVPTALFIDTEVFKRNALRLDTREFALLRTTFVKGGIRLLLPAMMERELMRHFERQAERCGSQWAELQKQHPLKSLKSWSPRAAEELSADCLIEMKAQWEDYKSHFTVESLPIVGDLDSVVDQYFGIKPPFSEKKQKEFPDAFVLSALDQYHKTHRVNIAIISSDGDFKNACVLLPYVRYFTSLEEYVNAFKPELSREEHAVEEPVDPLRPIVTEDLTELKGILGRGSRITPIERDRAIALLRSRGQNYDYFLRNAADPFWIPVLETAGFFTKLPEVEQTADGTTKIPNWEPIYYLEKVFDADPETVVRILESLPTTSNPRILQGVVSVASKCNRPELVARLASKILAAAESPRWAREQFIELLRKLSQW